MTAKLHTVNSFESPTMMFEGSACGKPATLLLDSGATHCFVDSTFATGLKQQATHTTVRLADGSEQPVFSHKTGHQNSRPQTISHMLHHRHARTI